MRNGDPLKMSERNTTAKNMMMKSKEMRTKKNGGRTLHGLVTMEATQGKTALRRRNGTAINGRIGTAPPSHPRAKESTKMKKNGRRKRRSGPKMGGKVEERGTKDPIRKKAKEAKVKGKAQSTEEKGDGVTDHSARFEGQLPGKSGEKKEARKQAPFLQAEKAE